MSPRERALGLVTLLVVLGALGFAWGEPQLRRWEELGDERARLEQEVDQARALAARRAALADERRALDVALRPPLGRGVKPELVDFVRELTREADLPLGALRFVRAQPLGARGEAPFGELLFDLETTVTLGRLEDFLVRLAAADRPVRVVQLSITPRREGSDLDVVLSLATLVPSDLLREEGGS